jgi:hypothetical protein
MLLGQVVHGHALVSGSEWGCRLLKAGFIDVQEADLWRERTLETAKRPDGPNAAARLRKLQAEAEIDEMKAAKLSEILKPVVEMENLTRWHHY